MEASPALSPVGLAGLVIMGQNLAFNIAVKGFLTSFFDYATSMINETVDRAHNEGNLPLFGHYNHCDFVLSIQRPRSVIILVKTRAHVDQTIAALSEDMDLGDVIIDGSVTGSVDPTAKIYHHPHQGRCPRTRPLCMKERDREMEASQVFECHHQMF